MGRFRKMLVAFDGSPSSANALRQAISLSRTEGGWIKVLSVVPSYEGDLELVGIRDLKKTISGPAESLLNSARDIARSESAIILTGSGQGEVYKRIVETADDEDCDLVVMGRRGMNRLERMLVGSVTARVIGHSSQDTLVVPADTGLAWETILVATDGSSCSIAAVEKAVNFARSYAGKLTAVSVVDVLPEMYAEAPVLIDELVNKAKGYVEEVRQKAGASGVEAETYVREGESYRTIIDIAEQKNAGLIVMGSHGRTGLKRLLMGSVTEKVIGLAPCPVLVAKSWITRASF
ncbi:MAG: universal stress protein [Candidatus Sulfobium sp.]|jgi:nucleotide-binding universal stress UspA family protein